MPSSQIEVTQLLLDWGNGDKAALDKLVPVVYQELRRLAGYYMRRERPGHTLQTSALRAEHRRDSRGARYLACHSSTRMESGKSMALSRDQGREDR